MKRLHRPILRAGAGGYGFIRSLNPAAWYRADTGVTVTGLGASTWADQSGNGRDLLQGTDASRPPYLSYSGTKYLYCPNVAANGASSPSAAANRITGDIDIRVRVSLDDWTPTPTNYILSKYAGAGARSYLVGVTGAGAGLLQIGWTTDGTTLVSESSSAAPTVSNGESLWLRFTLDVDNGAGAYEAKFYTAADSATEPTSWTQLGTTKTGGATTSIADTAGALNVSGFNTHGAGGLLIGKAYRASIYSTIGGSTPVVDFNPADSSGDGDTSWTSATGEVWTVNKSGGLPAQIVATSRLLGDGSGDKMATNAYVADQPRTRYIVCQAISWTAGDYLISGTGAEAGVTQVTATPQIGLNAGSAAAANSGLVLNEKHVVCAVLDGADSLLQIDLDTPSTGNAGTNDPDGIALFANQAGSGYFNGMVWEILDFDTAHDANQRARVIQYCAGRHGIAL